MDDPLRRMAPRHAGARPVGARGVERRARRGELPAAQRAGGRVECAHRARPGRGVVPRHRRRHEDVRRRRQQALPAVGLVLERRVAHLGRAYAPGGDNLWRFTQFGTLAIAVNGVDAPQKFDLSVGTNWTALGGSPPVGTFITTVRDFVVMGKIGSAPQRVQWCALNNAESWGAVAHHPGRPAGPA